jgi:hypothetical protein
MKISISAFCVLAICLCVLPIGALAQAPGGAATGLPPLSNAPSPTWSTTSVVASTVAAGVALGLLSRTSSNH